MKFTDILVKSRSRQLGVFIFGSSPLDSGQSLLVFIRGVHRATESRRERTSERANFSPPHAS